MNRRQAHAIRMRPYYVIRRTAARDEIVSQHSDRSIADLNCTQLNRGAARAGSAATYLVLQPLTAAIIAAGKDATP